jgi:hypothetical protein
VIQLSDQPDLPLEQGELGLAVDDSLLAPVEASDLPPVGENDCRVCGAFIAPGQDWCLECGAAVDEPRVMPGLATVGLAGVFTLVLAGGAVAAGVAALNDTIPPRDTKVETVAQEAPAEPAIDDTLTEDPLPPDTGSVDDQLTPVTPTGGSTDGGTTPVVPDDGGGGSTEPKPFDLPGSAAALYDPQMRFQASNDPALAIDGAKTPTWFVTTAADGNMNIGLQVDLQKSRKVTRLTMTTKTPGFTMYVLGDKGVDPPDDVSDMTTLGEAASIDAAAESGKPAPEPEDKAGDETFELGLGNADKKWRTIVLWFTVPPNKGPTVRISQLKFFDN